MGPRYRAGGLARLLEEKPRPGMPSRLHPEAYAGLETEMRAGRIATLAAARRYLAEHWGIEYGSITGVWWQLRRRGARPKTGRRRHVKADPAAQESFHLFADVDALDTALTAAWRPFWDDPPVLQRLTGYPWWLNATAAITPRAS